MTERFISDDFWDDPMIEECDTDGKCLYVYLFSNKHQKPHGIMLASVKKIASETAIKPEKVETLFAFYGEQHIKWMREKSLIWVKNFIVRQAKNASFLQSAINHLFLDIKDLALIEEYITYYDTLALWCKYGEDTVFTPSNTVLSCNDNLKYIHPAERGDTPGGKGPPSREREKSPHYGRQRKRDLTVEDFRNQYSHLVDEKGAINK